MKDEKREAFLFILHPSSFILFDMISLTCTNCRTVLTIDDAFAGGVCRCQHCGTIQTVPTHLKGSANRAPGATAATAAAGQKPQKAIFSRERAGNDRAAESGVR